MEERGWKEGKKRERGRADGNGERETEALSQTKLYHYSTDHAPLEVIYHILIIIGHSHFVHKM